MVSFCRVDEPHEELHDLENIQIVRIPGSLPGARGSPASAGGGAVIPDRVRGRLRAAAGFREQQAFPGLREYRQWRLDRAPDPAAAGLCGDREIDDCRGLQDPGHHRGKARKPHLSRRQGHIGDRKRAGKRPEISQMDVPGHGAGGDRRRHNPHSRYRPEGLSRRSHQDFAPHHDGAGVSADRGADQPGAVQIERNVGAAPGARLGRGGHFPDRWAEGRPRSRGPAGVRGVDRAGWTGAGRRARRFRAQHVHRPRGLQGCPDRQRRHAAARRRQHADP